MTNSERLSDTNILNSSRDKENVKYSDLVCIGTGLSGIGLGSQLRRQLKFESMHFYDRNESYSGTWWSNRYPGAACDVTGLCYSFSFHQNPYWSRFTPGFQEIQNYITSVVQKYELGRYMTFLTECQEARWDEDRSIWRLHLQDVTTGRIFVHECRILISGVGTFADPRIPSFPGADVFRGEQIHTARWKDNVSLQGRNVVVIGNGCTATQLIPALQPQVRTLTQIIRTPQWLLPSTNREFGPKTQWIFQSCLPLLTICRQYLFAVEEAGWPMLFLGRPGSWMRPYVEKISKEYIYANAPKEYHEMLIPTYPVGCKRRIYDPDCSYVNALHADNFKLTQGDIVRITEDGIQTTNAFYPADVIVYATGFETNGGLGKLRVYGKEGMALSKHWNEVGGRTAYNTIAVHGYPNFFMLFGPNGGTGHTSILMMIENAIVAIMEIIRPVLKGGATSIEVKKTAYEDYTRNVQAACKKFVTSASLCTNWYISSNGWNGTIYPWSQLHYWWRCAFPNWNDWEYKVSKLSELMNLDK